jgi:large subunit ribosomal protein L15
MPLHRRIPKRGFTNHRFKKEYAIVNLGKLEVFEAGTIVTPQLLIERGVLKHTRDGVKILGSGPFTKALTVRAHKFSAGSQEAIAKLGGKAELIEG